MLIAFSIVSQRGKWCTCALILINKYLIGSSTVLLLYLMKTSCLGLMKLYIKPSHDFFFPCEIKECCTCFAVLSAVSGLKVAESKLNNGK